ncbi:hypothetical protein WMY93_008710 [Mugilogobius chulae]|uniref:Ketohexokinase n=1 Tax=Mugilogobius chulae TaxID=88201 RepID=A0AAW0PIC3_9GOBI
MEKSEEVQSPEKRILCVGLVCLDIINVVDQFPLEDTDTRCVSQRWQRGGNASNSCSVLSLLGAKPAFMGSISPGPVSDFILEDFRKFHIDVSLVTEHAQCVVPASIVIGNRRNGSRTILHMNRNLPDVSLEDFSKVDLRRFHWIHFEGRNAAEQARMIQQVELWNKSVSEEKKKITVSVEIEKVREELYQLFNMADVVFVSKDVAQSLGFESARAAVTGLYPRVRPGSALICAWAELGADANKDGVLFHSPAFPPEKLLDTLGAGDTFNASVIFKLSQDPDQTQTRPGAAQNPDQDTLGAGDTFNASVIFKLSKDPDRDQTQTKTKPDQDQTQDQTRTSTRPRPGHFRSRRHVQRLCHLQTEPRLDQRPDLDRDQTQDQTQTQTRTRPRTRPRPGPDPDQTQDKTQTRTRPGPDPDQTRTKPRPDPGQDPDQDQTWTRPGHFRSRRHVQRFCHLQTEPRLDQRPDLDRDQTQDQTQTQTRTRPRTRPRPGPDPDQTQDKTQTRTRPGPDPDQDQTQDKTQTRTRPGPDQDTLGAGDTFNASVIFKLSQG